jgi:formylglycine-generating enzyme required for sulfatase activity
MENNRLDQLFKQAKEQQPEASFEETKESFLNALEATGKNTAGKGGNLFTFKKWIIMSIIGTITIAVGLSFLMPSEKKTNEKEIVTTINKEEINQETLQEEVLLQVGNKAVEKPIRSITVVNMVRPTVAVELKPENPLKEEYLQHEDKKEKKVKGSFLKNENKDSSYVFPSLTTEQIDDNNKQKKNMLKELSKLDKKEYAYIPSGTFEWDNTQISVQAFYMQTNEVTILAYRTFLFDLLIQGRKDDFLKAKPDQTKWMEHGDWMKPMQDKYFSHEAYNEYPINNISREGAEIYCWWITEEFNNSSFKKKTPMNDARIPSHYEWIIAASEGGNKLPYPWGGPYARNMKGCYLANFKPGKVKVCESLLENLKIDDKSEEAKAGKKYKTADDVYLVDLLDNNYAADGGLYTVKTGSYLPNSYGLFNMSGNVAEMVYYNNDKSKPGTKGGGWNSVNSEIQINGKDPYNGVTKAHSNIGFRVVITFEEENKKKEAFTPPNGKSIGNNLYMDATEITNFNWLEYLTWQKKNYGKKSNEYIKSLPDTNVWITETHINKPYSKHYLRNVAYREYPVVGISYEQVIAFCNWRTDRVKELYKVQIEKQPNKYYPKNFTYRLPTRNEWEKEAALNFNGEFIYSTKGKLDGLTKYNFKRDTISFISTVGNQNDNADITAPVLSYWTNIHEIYNMIGNVAEMTNEEGVAKGGSWMHTQKEISVESDFIYTAPESWLGFRCVFEIIEE